MYLVCLLRILRHTSYTCCIYDHIGKAPSGKYFKFINLYQSSHKIILFSLVLEISKPKNVLFHITFKVFYTERLHDLIL